MKRKRLSTDEYLKGILAMDTVVLSRAITLIESTKTLDEQQATELMGKLPLPGKESKCLKIGITGVPGVGKSTFIDTFGMHLISLGLKIAVLSIDPSSQRTRGSILGDKTRMEDLTREQNAYIRPSPSGSTLGGVAHKTHETIVLCEAAGFDCIIVETVGVGQSETMVSEMVDFFLLLMLAGGGDELQGIKRGIMEMADTIVIHKADGHNIKAARKARANYLNALHLFPPNPNGWIPKVLLCSSVEKTGIEEVKEVIDLYRDQTVANGFFQQNRLNQDQKWFENLLQYKLLRKIYRSPELGEEIRQSEAQVLAGKINVPSAVGQVIGKIENN